MPTELTAAELAEILSPLVDEEFPDCVELCASEWCSHVRLVRDPVQGWQVDYPKCEVLQAADLAAMHIIRRLKAEGWVPQFWPNTVRFWNGGDYPEEPYDKHPVQALAAFAARSRK